MRIHSSTAFEIADAARAYEATRRGLGRAFVLHLDAAFENIRTYPEMHASVIPGFRRAVLHRFPYSIVYRVGTDGIDILALLPTRANPDKLLDRLLALAS